MEAKKSKKSYKKITERFCPNLGDNAVIIKTVSSTCETYSCMSQSECKSENCMHKK